MCLNIYMFWEMRHLVTEFKIYQLLILTGCTLCVDCLTGVTEALHCNSNTLHLPKNLRKKFILGRNDDWYHQRCLGHSLNLLDWRQSSFDFHSEHDDTYVQRKQKYIEILIFTFLNFPLNFYILNWVRIES